MYYFIILVSLISLKFVLTDVDLLSNNNNINNNHVSSSQNSGVYDAYSRYSGETYAGAWWSSLNTAYSRIDELKQVQNLEGASFFMIFGTVTLMTRDYFDFFIIHLSSMVNVLIEYKLSSNVLTSVQTILSNRMRKNIKTLENENLKNNKKVNDFNDVVVVVPFSTRKAYYQKEDMDFFQSDIRSLFFEATFWSIYRYIPHIVVTYSNKADGDAISELNLPIWDLKDIENVTDHYARQPKESLLYVLNNWKERKPSNNISPRTPVDNWGDFKYIYFSEADEILYLRPDSFLDFLKLLHKNKNGYSVTALVPHRMQTMPLPKTFPSSLSSWNKSLIINSLNHINLITESVWSPTGSCCDDGRYIFKQCKAWWWYMCHRDQGYNYGAVNYTTWLRFGRNGFTFPTGTEHAAKCSYSSKRILCPIDDAHRKETAHYYEKDSKLCEKRIPTTADEVCTEQYYWKSKKISDALYITSK